jgi:alkylation response protein AidB-like acyl-CoA dehydrogenase
MYEAGYVGMLWPKEYGGRDATPMQSAIVSDEMARVSAPPPINGLGIGFIGLTIIVHGTAQQKERYLRKRSPPRRSGVSSTRSPMRDRVWPA